MKERLGKEMRKTVLRGFIFRYHTVERVAGVGSFSRTIIRTI